MSTKNVLIWSLIISSLIVLTGQFFYEIGERSLNLPGLEIQIILTGIMLLFFSTGDDYFRFPTGAEVVFGLIFYFVVIFLLIRGWQLLKQGPLK